MFVPAVFDLYDYDCFTQICRYCDNCSFAAVLNQSQLAARFGGRSLHGGASYDIAPHAADSSFQFGQLLLYEPESANELLTSLFLQDSMNVMMLGWAASLNRS